MTTTTVVTPHPIFLAGRWVESPDPLIVENPADPKAPAGSTYNATEAQYEEAVEAAVAAFEVTRHLPAYERGAILRSVSAGIKARREELGRLMATEAGKPIRDALVEVDRATLTFRLGAEEAERMTGEVIPLDLMASSRDRVGITRRFPIGPVAGISPFNFPLNLAAHKVAPAIAAGCSIVLKPPSKDPLTMLTVAEIIEEAGAPAGSVSILPMSRELGDRMVVGRAVQAAQLHRQPLGRLADEGAGRQEEGRPRARRQRRRHRRRDGRPRLGRPALPRRRLHATPGQVCISVQRMFVHEADLGRVHGPLRRGARRPSRSAIRSTPRPTSGRWSTVPPPSRTQRWVDEAVALGGKLLLGGKADGTFFAPTILTDTPVTAQVCSNEAFAPLVVAFPFRDFDDAIGQVNDSFFGLQTGVFTNDLSHAWRAFDELEVGGVIVNDVPTYRIDHMPYGGVKDSGLGREGLRWAIEDMTEIRIMVLAQPQ